MRMRIERHYSTGKAAEILGVCKGTIYNWIKEGKIEYARLPNGHYRIPELEIIKRLSPQHEEHVKTLKNVTKPLKTLKI
jgi:excisionase family DNA binding protein